MSFINLFYFGGEGAGLHDNDMFNSEFSLKSKIHKCCDLYDIYTLVTFMPLT